MISSRILPLALLLSIAIFNVSARAQNTKNDEATAALREKAYALLESVAGQIGTLQSAENRARIGANIADALWTHDEKLARSVLLQVEADITSELQKLMPRSPDDTAHHVMLKLRADTVERLAKHDAEAALTFLKATEIRSEDRQKYAPFDTDIIEMELAQKLVADHPEAAVKLAVENLDNGLNGELFRLLRRLNKKDRDSAQVLYRAIVKKLEPAEMNDWDTRIFVAHLTQLFRPPAADAATYRELVSGLVARALDNGCADKLAENDERRSYCAWLVNEVPELEKFDSRAARLKHWDTGPNKNYENGTVFFDLGEVMLEGTTEEVLAVAAKNPEYAESLYWNLIGRAQEAGDFDQVRKLANTYVTDPEARKSLLDQLNQFEKKMSPAPLSSEKMEEELNQLPIEQRGMFLISAASRAGSSDQKLALKLLDRANDLIDTMKPNKEQTAAQINLAVTYCFAKNERCLGLMESLVPRLNALVDVAARLDGYDTNYLRDGEWNMSANGAVGELLTRLSNNAAPFAWYDFDRAVSLAGRFDRQEIRMMAHVKLAQGILAGRPKRQPRAYTGF